MSLLKLVQLPIPPYTVFLPSGNVPLGAASMAVSMKVHKMEILNIHTEVIDPDVLETIGDSTFVQLLTRDNPEFIGFSLYLWNSERSLYIAQEIKNRCPNIKIIIGGPEVNLDNHWILTSNSYDYAVLGEGEEVFVKLIESLILGQSLNSIPNLIISGETDLSKQIYVNINTNIQDYPSPYLSDILPISTSHAIYLETIRGCRSLCSYCFYPKTSNSIRRLSIETSRELLLDLKKRGASELVFIDPTFNHRPKFEEFLDMLIEINSDKQFTVFGELRPEGLSAEILKKLSKANFTKIEIGLQSINQETLRIIRRHGNPKKSIEVAIQMLDIGIEPLIDLIIGLPNDTEKDILSGMEMIVQKGLAEYLQVFYLSVLSGTTLKQESLQFGLKFDAYPPYRIIETSTMKPKTLQKIFFEMEDILDRRMDENPRPFLCKKEINQLDVFEINLDTITEQMIQKSLMAGTNHFAYYISGTSLYKKLDTILNLIQRRIQVDPYCIIDFVLVANEIFPLDLLNEILELLSNAKYSYVKRILTHRKEDMLHRLVVLIPENGQIPLDWKLDCMEICQVYEDMQFVQAVLYMDIIGIDFPCIRIIDEKLSKTNLQKLQGAVDWESISFQNRELEKEWVLSFLSVVMN